MTSPPDDRITFLKSPGVRMERLLPGPVERVWEHLTNTGFSPPG